MKKECQATHPFQRLNIITKTTGTSSLGCPIAPLQFEFFH